MGVLLNPAYWCGVINEIHEAGNHGTAQERSAEVRRIACQAFSTLLNDPEYDADLATIIAMATPSPLNEYRGLDHYRDYIDMLLMIERGLVKRAGASDAASDELIRQLAEAAEDFDGPAVFDRLRDKIELCMRLSCSDDADVDEAGEQGGIPQSRWAAARKGILGVAAISANAGSAAAAAVTMGPAGAAAAGVIAGGSIGLGATLIRNAVRRWW